MGPATVACRKLDVKIFLWNCTVFWMKPQEGIGCPSAPLRRGPDGLVFLLQGTMLNVNPVSTKYLSCVNSSVKKIKPASAGKCIAVAVACVWVAAEPKVVWRLISFPNKHRAECTCEPYGRSSCEIYRCHCQGFERNRNLGGRGATFGAGVTAPFVASPPAAGSRAPTSLSRGGRDRRIVAASSIPQGIRGLHHGRSCRVVASSYCFTHGRGKANKKHGQKKIIVWRSTGWKMLFNFPMRTLGLRPCIPWGGVAAQNRTATCSFQTAQAKCFSTDRKAHQSRCTHPMCQECPERHAWAGWPEHWHIWVFGIWSLPLQTEPRWGGTRCEVPPHRRDKVWPE